MSDEEPSLEEMKEAEALARALERGTGDAPEEALQAAGLLAYARTGGELEKERHDEILYDVLRTAKTRRETATKRWRWALGAAFAGLGTVLAIIALADRVEEPYSAAIPEPSPSLLRTQVGVASGAEPLDRLEAEMGEYRLAVYRSLEAR